MAKTPKKYYIMYTHARYYIILLRHCTKGVKVCKIKKTGKQVNRATKKTKTKRERKRRQKINTIRLYLKCIKM